MSLKTVITSLNEMRARKMDATDKFKKCLTIIRDYMASEFNCKPYEISLLLKDKKDYVHFVLPIPLFERGNSFPLQTSKVTRKVIELNRPVLENNAEDSKRLVFYEKLRDADDTSIPIQKFIAAPLYYKEETFGAMWLNRRAHTIDKAGPDWTQQELSKAVNQLKLIVPHLYELRPEKYS